MNFGQKARDIAKQANQEKARRLLAEKEAERRRAAEQYREKLEEIDAIAAQLADIVTAEAKRGAHKAFIEGGILSNERALWTPVENRCKELGINYHMIKNHHPSCWRKFLCSCGNSYHLEVSW